MLKVITETIKQYEMFNPGDSAVIGLSGGADSVALLHVLLTLKDSLGLAEIFAVHVNHQLRGADAASDEVFAAQFCRGLGVELKIYHANVREIAECDGIGLEEAGRNARYFHLHEAAREFGVGKIALGHNRDDVAETVLMNLCRGTGLRGLRGIPAVNGAVVRPLINVPRSEIDAFIKEVSLPYVTDMSNFSPEFTRNRVRNIVFPMLEQNLNPQVKAVIARNASWLKDDEEFLAAAADAAFVKCVMHDGEKIIIDTEEFVALPMALKRRVVRNAITLIRGGFVKDVFSASHIQAVLDLAQGQTGRSVDLPGILAEKEYSRLIMSAKTKIIKKSTGFCYKIVIDKPVFMPEINKTFVLTYHPPDANVPICQKTPILYCTKAVECDIVKERFFIRTRLPGDCIALEGFTKKLQDYFVNAKIPREQRDLIPLLANEREIICILDKQCRAKKVHDKKKTFWATLWSKCGAGGCT